MNTWAGTAHNGGSEQPSALHAEGLVLGLVCARPHLQTLPAAGRPASDGGRFRLRLLLVRLLVGFSARGAWASLPPAVSCGPQVQGFLWMPCNVLCFLSHLEHLSGAHGAPRQALPPSVSVEDRSLAREMPLLVDSL